MKKSLIAVGILGLIVGISLAVSAQVRAENNEGNSSATTGDHGGHTIMPVSGLVGTIKAKSVDDLDDDNQIPDISKGGRGQTALVIGPKGKVTLFGATVVSDTTAGCSTDASSTCATHSLSVKVWGLTLSVNTTANTTVIPSGTTFAVGDSVSVKGTIDASSGVITAQGVRNLSKVDDKSSEISGKIQDLLNKIKQFCTTLAGNKPAICSSL